MDYGHPLIFGARISANSPDAAVTVARSAESLGINFLALEPHELDTWTAATWLAGATTKARIRASVDLSQTQFPAVVARAAASADLLSGGRMELELTFSTANDSEQGKEESVEVLTQAAQIVRSMWSGSQNDPLHFQGSQFHVPGTTRGPAPAHSMGVWFSGKDVSTFRAVAEEGDGWVLDATYSAALNLDELGKLHRGLDTLIVNAGRDPREVRRQIVLSPEQIKGFEAHDASQTTQFLLDVVEAGFSEILFATSDAEILEYVRALRADVFAQLARSRTTKNTSTGVLKNARARAQRVSLIDYESLPQSLRAISVEPGDPHYSAAQNTYLRGGRPGLVLRAHTVEHVQDAVKWAQTQDVEFSIRSGGHGFSGRSTNRGGIVLDLRELNSIEVIDAEQGLVKIGPGAQWAHVAAALEPYNLAISSGDAGSVGVGGLATVGGLGFFGREHGLTIDYIQGLDIVSADGALVHADAHTNPELFWGMRGAGPNFGIVTSFLFKAQKVGQLAHVQLAFQVEDLEDFLVEYGKAVEQAPRDTTLFLMAGRPQRGRLFIAQLYGIVDNPDPDTVIERLQPFAMLSPLVGQQVYMTTYSTAIGQGSSGPQRSGALEHITPAFARAASNLIYSGETYFFQIRTAGGAVADVAEDATAFAFRSATFHVLAMGSNRTRLDLAWDGLDQYFDGFYLNFETDTSPGRVQQGFSPNSWQRLKALKKQWDPRNVFNDNFNIPPQ